METKEANFVACSKFREVVTNWVDWVTKGEIFNKKQLAIAMTKPDGLHNDLNLILDENGRVWRSNWTAGSYEELVRDAPFAEYRLSGDNMMSQGHYNGGHRQENCGIWFVAKGYDDVEGDWCWVPSEHGHSTRRYHEVGLVRDAAGLAMGRALLGIDTERLCDWIMGRVTMSKILGIKEKGNRTRDNTMNDWGVFQQVFALPSDRDIPDHGSVLAAVHVLVDQAVPGGVDTRYFY